MIGDRRAVHVLEWIARAVSFTALAVIAIRDALLCDRQCVTITVAVVVVAFAYSALAFRLRLGQLGVGNAPAARSSRSHPYR